MIYYGPFSMRREQAVFARRQSPFNKFPLLPNVLHPENADWTVFEGEDDLIDLQCAKTGINCKWGKQEIE